ncbi:MAG: hypothetical protein PHY48_01035 [Candidatus Cloacimonetes bacterium]|nr:hypothetical protein [Candidatus Cloacimonadota bacterium]
MITNWINSYGKYADEYLICDGRHPLISNDSLADELKLYNLQYNKDSAWLKDYLRLTGKQLSPETRLEELSGGQKTLLMLILSLSSPAAKICYWHLLDSLDEAIRREALRLIDNAKTTKDIVCEPSATD